MNYQGKFKRKNKKWNIENIKIEALKFNSKTEWAIKSNSSYKASKKLNCFEDSIKHMEILGSRFKRFIYVFEFLDKSIYVGLTYDLSRRKNEHLTSKKSTVYKYIKKTELVPIFIQKTKLLDKKLASIVVGDILEHYNKKGWNILNKNKCGALGCGIIFWTKKKCVEAGLLCNTKSEFKIKFGGAYNSAKRNGWLKECYNHMPKNSHLKWTKEKCLIEAKKYKTKTEFIKNNRTAYNSTLNNGWLKECCKHMKKQKIKWTKEKCLIEAKKYKTKSEFKKNSSNAYQAAHRNNWYIDITKHMILLKKPNNYWTLENCLIEVKKYKSYNDFKKNQLGAHDAITKNKWYNEFKNINRNYR